MGYRQQAQTYHLVWPDDGPFAGLEVRARSLPIGAFLDAQGAQIRLRELVANGAETVEELGEVLDPLRRLAGAIISWTIEDQAGRPVPSNIDGWMSLSQVEVTEIVTQWAKAGTTVPAPLEPPSTDGDMEASIPMDDLPESPGS